MNKVRVLMLKTAAGPGCNHTCGSKPSIDDKLAIAWAKCPDPVCEILPTLSPYFDWDWNWVNYVNFGRKKAPSSPAKKTPSTPKKAPRKYRPGAKK
jgi:hypothetical protein